MNKNKFEKFYRENVDKLYRFVFFRSGQNKQLAEDLVSEIFMKALENFDRYDVTKSTTAWLFTIAKNHLVNHWRDTRPSISLAEINTEGEEEKFWKEISVVAYKKAFFRQELADYLIKLSVEEREIVTFHYLFGYSYLEIAEIKNSTEGAIKVAAHRAIKALRKLV